jgi:hypothetical protein
VNPFVGLRPFREDERTFFMGREIAASYVETRAAGNPLTLLFARSGVGKSSFLTSRLIPQVRQEGPVLYINEWGSQTPEHIVESGLRELKAETSKTNHLILDQFEDVFKQDRDHKPLWEVFAEVANTEPENLSVLVTMREEWLGAWEEVEQYVPTAFSSMVRLAPLTNSELRRAIVNPIEIEGSLTIEKALVSRLLNDLRQPNAFGLGGGYVEPGLLQLVCRRLWDAAAAGSKIVDDRLYEALGRADQIIREFVWQHLRDDAGGEVFPTDQRVLWAGLIRHLSASHGVKATVTSEILSRKLILSDLGIVGPAFAVSKGRDVRDYLKRPVESREQPPSALIQWMIDTLTTAHQFGFLKRQQGFQQGNSRNMFELAHDSLDDVFRAFSLEFEKWISRRVYKLYGILYGVLFILPILVYFIITEGILWGLVFFLIGVIGLLIYLGVFLLFRILGRFLARVILFPVLRWLARGKVIPSTKSEGKPSSSDQRKY